MTLKRRKRSCRTFRDGAPGPAEEACDPPALSEPVRGPGAAGRGAARSNRCPGRRSSQALCAGRERTRRLFSKINGFGRIVRRSETRATPDLARIALAAIRIRLRLIEPTT